MKDNDLHLSNEIYSEFLMLISNWNQSFKVEGKKEYLKQFVQQLQIIKLLFLVLKAASHFGIKVIK